MSFIYDILLNFSDSNKIYEFYEWEQNDNLINVKKIPIFKVMTDTLLDIYNYKVKFSDDFVSKIENSSSVYRQNKNSYKYLAIFSDGNKAFAVNLGNNGIVKNKSNLLIAEEEEVLYITERLDIDNIEYKKLQKEKEEFYGTRREQEERTFLLKWFKKLYKDNDVQKLKYLYFEYFDKLEDDIENIYNELVESLNNIDGRHEELYKLLKLTCKK